MLGVSTDFPKQCATCACIEYLCSRFATRAFHSTGRLCQSQIVQALASTARIFRICCCTAIFINLQLFAYMLASCTGWFWPYCSNCSKGKQQAKRCLSAFVEVAAFGAMVATVAMVILVLPSSATRLWCLHVSSLPALPQAELSGCEHLL